MAQNEAQEMAMQDPDMMQQLQQEQMMDQDNQYHLILLWQTM